MTTQTDTADRPVLPRIVRLLAPYRLWLAAVGLAVVVSAGLTSIAPFLVQRVFDDALFPTGGAEPDLDLLWWLVGGLIAIPIVSALIGIGQTYMTTRVGNQAMADLRVDLFNHLQRMELAFFTSTKTGAIQSRLANDVAGVGNVLTSTAVSILSNVVTVAAAFIAMVILSWQLTIITLILMPLFVTLQIRVGRRRRRLARKTQESLSEMTAITEESLSVSGILLAKVFNRADAEAQRYREENDRQVKLQLRQRMTGQSFFAMVSTFFAVTPAIIYLVAGYIVADGTGGLTAGTIVAFTTLQARLQMPLMQLMRVSLDVQTSLALFRRLFEYLDLEPAIQDRTGATAIDPHAVRGEVEFRDVWFRYPESRTLAADAGGRSSRGGREGDVTIGMRDGARPGGRRGIAGDPEPELTVASGAVLADEAVTDEQQGERIVADETPVDGAPAADDVTDPIRGGWALQGVSLRIEPGQLAAVVGPSGSGKTTMTYLIPRLHEVTDGAVLIDGRDVRDVTMSSLADVVGMVTQEPYLFHGTIAENLRYARPDASDDELIQAARDANIHDRILGFDRGYDTMAGERGYRLSGGEKQRLAIARVFLMDPKILILDEATSALDTGTERLVQEALERAMAGRTTLAIAHRLSTIMNADVILGLEEGTLVERGTHAELLEHGGLYARLYAEQFGGGAVEARFDDAVAFTDGSRMPCCHSPRADVSV
jgi:ATP-binding cassette subfamily B protein